MSDDNLDQLRTVQARALYANFTLTMVEIGIHLFMALYGLSVFLETPESQRKGRKRYIAVSFVITALRALTGSIDMANYFQALFNATSPGHWRDLMIVDFYEGWKHFLSNTGVGLIPMIGDALLIYRCYIVCVEYWWVTILPTVTSLAALALFIATFVNISNVDNMKYGSASTYLTVSTNIVVTSFITFRLLRARRTLAKLLPSTDMRVYTGVIAILIESAAPLTVFGIIAAILQQLSGSPHPTNPGFYSCEYLFQALFYSFCALSPHMIIFRVTTGRSFTRFPTVKDGSVVSNPIQFAESSFLQSTLNREFGRNPDPDIERDGHTQTKASIIRIGQEKRNDSGSDVDSEAA